MTRKLQLTATLFFALFVFDFSVAQTPRVLNMNGKTLSSLKKQYSNKQPEAIGLINDLLKEADKQLSMKPISVMDKTITPPSGSKHDYMSQAPYFWYDSSKPNGLPYLRRDGERNPEITKITDRQHIGSLDYATRILGLAWYFTKDEKYAQKSAELLRHWFLNVETKMNPNLDYGQGIPGINTGRGIGIIETISLMGITDAAGLIEKSAAWTRKDKRNLKKWYSQYLDWMLTSKNGKEERAAKNNHGSWYFAQAVNFALFTGNTALAKQLTKEAIGLMEGQIDTAGKQVLELERTNALWYSTYNLQAWFRLAALAEKLDTDIWNHSNQHKTGIRAALDWLVPYATGKTKFPYQQIDGYNKNAFSELLMVAAKAYHDDAYLKNRKEFSADKSALGRILYPY